MELTLRYTTPDIRCRHRRHECDGGIRRTTRHTDEWAALHRSRPPADQSGKHVASWTSLTRRSREDPREETAFIAFKLIGTSLALKSHDNDARICFLDENANRLKKIHTPAHEAFADIKLRYGSVLPPGESLSCCLLTAVKCKLDRVKV